MLKTNTKEKKESHDLSFITAVQPQGGLAFKDSYIRKGDGYEAVIYVYRIPVNVYDFWLADIFNVPDCIVAIDMGTEDRGVAMKDINKALTENLARYATGDTAGEQLEANEELRAIRGLHTELSRHGENLKLINIRISVHKPTVQELDKKVTEILQNLESVNFRGAVLLNEQEYEWRSLLLPYSEQIKLANKRTGKGISSYVCAASFPFNFSELKDPYGALYGFTSTGGSVCFDLFHKDFMRKYYNAVVVGAMGSGKSTLLKKVLTDRAVRNDYVRGFDITGEFETLVEELDGTAIVLDGGQGLINPLEVMASHEDNYQSYTQHLSKMKMFYRFLAPSASDEIVLEFANLLDVLYSDFFGHTKRNITGQDPKAYPTFSQLLQLCTDEIEREKQENSSGRLHRLESIGLVIRDIVTNYSKMFDGHTTIQDISNEQVVFFSLRSLISQDIGIMNAQLFNILTLVWDNAIKHGSEQKHLFEEGKVSFEDVQRFLVVLDEAHRLINANNPLAVEWFESFMREARKYFAGILFASQSVRDFVPDTTDSQIVASIKKLFELTQYKFIFQQDTNTLEALTTIFSNQLSDSELGAIPTLLQGETVLVISGVKNIKFKVHVADVELALHKGGA